MKHFIVLIFLTLPTLALSQVAVEQEVKEPKIKEATKPDPLDNEPVVPPQDTKVKLGLPEPTPSTPDKDTKTGVERYGYFAMLNYSPIDLLIPSKIGLTAGMVTTNEKTWELEYLRGSLSVPFVIEDLGKMTDERFSLIGRYYSGSSFNWSYGVTYFGFKSNLGSKYIDRLPGGDLPSNVDVIDVQALGFNVGLGNHWKFGDMFMFGIDWFTWSQPLLVLKKESGFTEYATNTDDKDIVEKAINTVSYFPRLTFLKLQVGMSF